jgi:hypothetical protein
VDLFDAGQGGKRTRKPGLACGQEHTAREQNRMESRRRTATPNPPTS